MARLRILITGANGFLGSHILKYLYSKDHNVSILNRSDIKNIFLSKDFINNNFFNFESIPILNEKYDCLIHMAALPYSEAEKSIREAEIVNTKLTDYLAKYCQINNIYFLFFSTVQVYGSILQGTYTESTLPNPETIYSKTKREAEMKIIDRIDKFNLRGKILRIGNIVGKPLSPSSSGWKLFANKIILDSIIEKKISITNNPYLRRSFLSIDFLLNFIDIFIDNIKEVDCLESKIINLTSEKSTSLIDFALMVIKSNQVLKNRKVELSINKNLISHVPDFKFSNSILKKIIPDLDRFNLEIEIKKMIFSLN